MGTLTVRFFIAASLASVFLRPSFAQDSADRVIEAQPAPEVPKRIFGIIPNNRTAANPTRYEPLTTREKFKIAEEDSLDRGTFLMAAGFAGLGQITNSTPSFGQGVAGYSRYLGTSYGDFAIGNFMTEAIYPSLLHQDPRYFRRGTGSFVSRLGYAASQIFWTHRDAGGAQFNFSEILGNSTAVAISNAYYPDNRSASAAAGKLSVQIGVDMAGNILKEFAPDLARKFSRRKNLPDSQSHH
jgi:hypothetical protein